MREATLLKRCAGHLANGELGTAEVGMLEQWNAEVEQRISATTAQFLSTPSRKWETLVVRHPAYHHPWYSLIADGISIDEMARFLLENSEYPVFLHLLEAIEQVQICDEGRRAVRENIADECEPEPHADLMRRMMAAVQSRARPELKLSVYPSLVDRTLVFYYGYYCNPWYLVGAVFATECMGTRRVTRMRKGLRRLGLNDHELAFTTVHSECDDHHASDWLERVITPSVELDDGIRAPIAKGIAACLETSHDYLDYLLRRARCDPLERESPVTLS